jgi:tRNA-Thr(GGU) m(6)t(6)A37 methyltransferase TsaA
MRIIQVIMGCVIILSTSQSFLYNTQVPEDMNKKKYILEPIGRVKKENKRTLLVLREELAPALKGLDGFSHVWVLWWFDRNDEPEKRSVLQVHPRGNKHNPLTGVFACRAPVRPNLIGLTLCHVLSVQDSLVEIEKIDALDTTPILDLKPYIPGSDSVTASVPDWLNHR